MAVPLEQIQTLQNKTGVCQEEAKAALEHAEGNLLDAVLYLEREGQIPTPAGGFYSTHTGAGSQQSNTPMHNLPPPTEEETWRDRLYALLSSVADLLRHYTEIHITDNLLHAADRILCAAESLIDEIRQAFQKKP